MRQPAALLSQWLAKGGNGTLTLKWEDKELVIRAHNGVVHSLEGPDPVLLARMVGSEARGFSDLLTEAQQLATYLGIPTQKVVAEVKRLLQQELSEWFMAPDAKLEIDPFPVSAAPGPRISLRHALVEMVLSDRSATLARLILPDPSLVLERGPAFLERYRKLGLPEEADLVAAKIDGKRTVSDIASRSPHPETEVKKLLAGLLAAGLLAPAKLEEKPKPSSSVAESADLSTRQKPSRQKTTIKIPWWVLALSMTVATVVLVIAAIILAKGHKKEESSTHWCIVVDSGCEGRDYERLLRKYEQYKGSGRLQIRSVGEEGSDCQELVWGDFASEAQAVAAVKTLPKGLVSPGFQPRATLARPTPEDGGSGVH